MGNTRRVPVDGAQHIEGAQFMREHTVIPKRLLFRERDRYGKGRLKEGSVLLGRREFHMSETFQGEIRYGVI